MIVRIRLIAGIVVILLLLPMPISADDGTARVFYYGDMEDRCLGRRHAASWWGQTPDGWPEVVDLIHYGIATSDWSIPFGTIVCIRIIGFPAWAEDEYAGLVSNTACGIVVGRMPVWSHRELGPSFDLWPALFQRLAGKDWKRIGTFTVEYWMYRVAQEDNDDGSRGWARRTGR